MTPEAADGRCCATWRLLQATDIEHPEQITTHVLRHTHATHAIAAGCDLFYLSRRLGHASATFTADRYGHLMTGRQTEAATAFDRFLGSA